MYIKEFIETKNSVKTWPKGNKEEVDGMKYIVSTDNGDKCVDIWYTMRDERARILVDIEGTNEVQFRGIDDFSNTGNLVGLIKQPKSNLHYRPGVDILPIEYTNPPVDYTPLNIVVYKEYIKEPKAYNSYAILLNVGDITKMIYHGVIQARFAGRL